MSKKPICRKRFKPTKTQSPKFRLGEQSPLVQSQTDTGTLYLFNIFLSIN
jgi:hypothetical protein